MPTRFGDISAAMVDARVLLHGLPMGLQVTQGLNLSPSKAMMVD